jgi:integrase
MASKTSQEKVAGRVSKSGKSAAGRQSNKTYRSREHLRDDEVDKLRKAARDQGRHGLRDDVAILMAYRHGLRASELCGLKWEQIDLNRAELHVKRLKAGKPATHPILGKDLRLLRTLLDAATGPYVFSTERGSPLDRSGFLKIVRRAGEVAGFAFKVHPHMLRHATGFHLANKGTDTRRIQDYLGHQNIQHTVRYTELAPGKFKGLWD